MNGNKIIIGSRGSDLALWQANYISGRLAESGCETEISIIKTKGDDVKLSFDKMEGKGFFTREIEEALLGGKIDLAVHSFKDLETVRPAGLKIATVTERANPADILLLRRECIRPRAFLSLEK
ncbi:MAG: hydroxymethylbilane synthase, partial [Flavobacteriales bacterium]